MSPKSTFLRHAQKPVSRLSQALVANIDYDDFKGKLGVGRIHSGSLRKGQTVGLGRPEQAIKTGKVAELFVFDNLGRSVRAQ